MAKSFAESDAYENGRQAEIHAERDRKLEESLIHTCELNGANPSDYITQLQRHAAELKRQLSEWMPWNYRDTLEQLTTPAAA